MLVPQVRSLALASEEWVVLFQEHQEAVEQEALPCGHCRNAVVPNDCVRDQSQQVGWSHPFRMRIQKQAVLCASAHVQLD